MRGEIIQGPADLWRACTTGQRIGWLERAGVHVSDGKTAVLQYAAMPDWTMVPAKVRHALGQVR